MKVHNQYKLHEFSGKHPPARLWVRTWLAEASAASWTSSHDIKYRYRAASFVGSLVIFNVKGNDYRLVTQIAYRMGIIVVKWIGTHDAYDRVNWETAKDENDSRKD